MLPALTSARSIGPTAPILLLALLVTASVEAGPIDKAQPPYWVVSSVTTREDIFPGPFWTVMQDRIGYLWLLVGSDVVRFDGVRFAELADLRPDSTIRPGTAWSLCVTRDGSTWVGHGEGTVTRLQARTATSYQRENGLSVGRVESLWEDRNGTVWARGPLGLALFRDNRWQRLDLSPDSPIEHSATGIFDDSRGNFWVGTRAGIFVRRAGRDTFDEFSAAFKSVLGFGEDGSGAMWITDSQQGIRRLSTSGVPSLAALPLGSANGTQILTDRQGGLWVATRGQGLWRLAPPPSEGAPPSRSRFTRQDGLPSDIIYSLFEDRDGNVWVGTDHALVMLAQRGRMQSVRLSGAYGVTAARDGSVWVGTTDGLLRYVGPTRRLYGRQDGLPGNTITALSVDPAGQLLVATDRGLARFAGGRFVPVHLPWPEVRINAMTTDSRGALWLCVFRQGLFRGSSDRLDQVPEAGGRTCRAIYTDRSGRVWTGFTDGTIAVYDGERFHMYAERDGLGGSGVNSIYQDETGTIWFGTDGGLSRFRDGTFVSFSRASGLPSKAVFSILGDSQGHLWCGVISAIMRISPSELEKAARDRSYRPRYNLYDSVDGLIGSQVSFVGASPNAAREVDGRLWFVTTNGISIVSPGQLPEYGPPAPVIESITANRQTSEPVANQRLSSGLSELQIHYTALNFSSPQKTRFRHFLQGFDREWVDAGPRREAIYTNLAPGSYQFRVTATNGGNEWHETGAVWNFVIEPRFYQTAWFPVACLATVILAIYAGWQFRLRQIRVELAIMFAERTRLAREIHDTLLQSLVGVALQLDVIAQRLDASPAIARQSLHRMRDEVEQYIREARQSIWDLRSPVLQTRDLVRAVREMCQSLAGSAAARLEFVVSGTPSRIDVKAEEHLLRICHEAIVNALHHADAAHIRVELCYSDDALVLRVSDDGRGFDPEAKMDDRWGLTDMRERVQQIRGRFSVTTAPGQGTRVEAVVPIATQG